MTNERKESKYRPGKVLADNLLWALDELWNISSMNKEYRNKICVWFQKDIEEGGKPRLFEELIRFERSESNKK